MLKIEFDKLKILSESPMKQNSVFENFCFAVYYAFIKTTLSQIILTSTIKAT